MHPTVVKPCQALTGLQKSPPVYEFVYEFSKVFPLNSFNLPLLDVCYTPVNSNCFVNCGEEDSV